MALISSKKAVFFSLIAVMMSTLFILLFSGVSHVALDERARVTQYDVLYVNNFVGDLDKLVGSSAARATFFILNDLALKSENISSGDSEKFFLSCFMNDSFGSPAQDCNEPDLNHSFESIFSDFQDLASYAYGADVTLDIINVSFRQTSNYYVEINITCEVNVTDLGAFWSRIISSSQEISLVGVTDPLTVGTSYKRPITLWPNELAEAQRIQYFGSNFTRLEVFVSGGHYFLDNSSPSFIDRLEGNLPGNASGDFFNSFGIGSFIPDNYTPYLGNTTSYVLHHNFSGLTFNSSELRRINVSGINTNFSIPINYIQYVMNAYNGNCPGGVDPEIFNVSGCCTDVDGCNSTCGAPPECSV